jgi:uncharacterized RDD family membrane protein YckC
MIHRTLIVGRNTGDIRLADETVSDPHAELRPTDGRWHVRDLNSRNGTWLVRGEQHIRHHEGPVPMDQVISVGRYRTTIRNLLQKANLAQPPERNQPVTPTRCLSCGCVLLTSSPNCPVCEQQTPTRQGDEAVLSVNTGVPLRAPPVAPPHERVAMIATANLFAGFWRRVAAALIDSFIFIAIGAVFVLVTGVEPVGRIARLVSMVAFWQYFALMESSSRQATIGKLALRIQVTDTNGGRIGYGRATGRHFAKLLSSITLLVGYMMAGFTRRRQCLHDMVAGTLVINIDR